MNHDASPELLLITAGLAVLLVLSDSLSDLVVVGLVATPFAMLGGMYLLGSLLE